MVRMVPALVGFLILESTPDFSKSEEPANVADPS
jgi:hypothetical protein